MKKKTYWLLAAAMTMAGCASDSDLNGGDDSAAEAAVAVSATRAANTAETESLAEGETFRLINKTRQEKGKTTKYDAVYVVGADGKALPQDDNSYVVWQTGIFSQGNPITANEFQAVIPATADYASHTLPTDQSDADKLKSADWQTATCRHDLANAADGITLNFEHQYAKLHFDVTLKDDATAATITDVTILDEITPYINENTIEAIIPPTQTYTNLQPPTEPTPPLIKLEIAGETLTAPLPTDITFEPGKQYNFTLAVGHDAVTISAVTVTDWQTGTITGDEAVKTKPYVTFTADAEQIFKMTPYRSSTDLENIINKLEYSVGNGEWTQLTKDTEVTFGGTHGALRLRGKAENGTAIDYGNYCKITFTKYSVKVQCTGDIRTLQDYMNYNNVNPGKFCSLFQDCRVLETAPKLPAKTLADFCYNYMFSGCSALTKAPELPATTLAGNCYNSMFQSCTMLETAPKLPATALASNCYRQMFWGCSKLTSAPALPATTLADECYRLMFNECTALSEAPELPATALAKNCYYSMFNGCTALTKAPKLPATTLAQGCYSNMFNRCSALTTAPELKAETLEQDCYKQMFFNCTSLKTAPALPATTLAQGCYNSMFYECTSLKNAPELPATKMEQDCYNSMFYKCTSLETAPALPATTLATACYKYMFSWCTALKSVTMLTPADAVRSNHTCFDSWLSNGAGKEAPSRTLTLLSNDVYKAIKNQGINYYLPEIWKIGSATVIDKDGNTITE